jgi:orotidine-5'-phosphate decarboxylase
VADVIPRAIVALDVPSEERALAVVRELGETCDFVKVGSELFTAAGPRVMRALREEQREIFLDLKFHDIPNTVRGAAKSAAAHGARLITVHASGGRAMIEAAVEGAAAGAREAMGAGAGQGDRHSCQVLAVTVLTSLDATMLGELWARPVDSVIDEVLRLAELARSAGAHGIVCSGAEAEAVHARFGDSLALLVPGIRLSGGATHDQKRVVTPGQAIAAGASYLVLGRAVLEASDPRAALRAIQGEIAASRERALGARLA